MSDHIVCPKCHGENPPTAIFCQNPRCRKALGEFRFAIEELRDQERWHEKIADTVADWIGTPAFVAIHVLFITIWAIINLGWIMGFKTFDAYPFSLLGFILGVEALLATSIVLISQNRQNDLAETRAEIDYEVNVQGYRLMIQMTETMGELAQRLEELEKRTRPQESL